MNSQDNDRLSFDPHDAVCQQLEEALHADDGDEKDFYIRQALQATEAIDDDS